MKLLISKLITGVLLVSFAACAPKLANSVITSKKPIFYPEELDTAHIQYLTSYSNSLQITGKQSSFTSSIVGKQEVAIISKPYGVTIKNNKIYVCDVTLKGLEIIDLKNNTFNHFIPEGKRKLSLPLNSFVDDEGKIYIVDATNHKIAIYDNTLNFIKEFGNNTLVRPTDIFVKNNKIYVTDVRANRVNIYDQSNYELLDYFPKSVEGNEDWLSTPTNIFISDKRIYVSDMGATNIKVYSLKGEHILNIGSIGSLSGQFVRPKGVAADKDDNVYVVDGAFENVQIFNKEGQLLMYFGGAYQGPGDMYLPTQITIDYDNLEYFQQYVDPRYDLKHLILVANQFGPDKISVYGRIVLKK